MPRDGDPMSDAPGGFAPDLFHAGSTAYPARPSRASGEKPPRPPPPGQPTILLSARNARGGSVLLSFSRARNGIEFWRSLCPERSTLQRVASFPGKFTPGAVARLLASGAVRPGIDAKIAEDAEVDALDGIDAALLRLAWSRTEGSVDPRVAAVLRLPGAKLAQAATRMGWDDGEGILHLGAYLLKSDADWLATWRTEVDAEVDRRALLADTGEVMRRALRAFVEECLLTLGRLPRVDETRECWDGAVLRTRAPGARTLRRLGLHQTGRVRRFHAWVRFRTAADSYGYSDYGSGPGWYWDVANPDPRWLNNCTMGPYKTSEEAWSDASFVGQDE